jgi:hypothetical protein
MRLGYKSFQHDPRVNRSGSIRRPSEIRIGAYPLRPPWGPFVSEAAKLTSRELRQHDATKRLMLPRCSCAPERVSGRNPQSGPSRTHVCAASLSSPKSARATVRSAVSNPSVNRS